MRCQRCGGIMVSEVFYGLHDVFQGYRCLFCGEIIDPVILRNRLTQGTGRPARRYGGRKPRPLLEGISSLP
ncbi:MAG: hypothetical protein N3G78_00720 [Desulfobacterota bacterium]|nr:hypothetical protein [Thermodesulfobacteriota bacterium]